MTDEQTTDPVDATLLWRTYREGGKDAAERLIEGVVAHDHTFVIYTTRGTDDVTDHEGSPVLYYHIDGEDEARSYLAEANVLVAQIHSLAPRKSKYRVVIDKQLAAAYELALRNKIDNCKIILEDVLNQLEGTQTAKGQLRYMATNVLGCAAAWIGYAVWYHFIHDRSAIDPAGPWILAGALGTLGGVLSVAINLKGVQIGLHQHWLLHCFAGWTRNVVAFVGGIACLLAIRSKMALGAVITTDDKNLYLAGIAIGEAFFCFVAGFSESLVPNILRDSEQAAPNQATPPAQKGGSTVVAGTISKPMLEVKEATNTENNGSGVPTAPLPAQSTVISKQG